MTLSSKSLGTLRMIGWSDETAICHQRHDAKRAVSGEKPSRQVLWRRTDVVRPHHFVVLVLDDVAMPHIKARQIE
jgi:hypothetical protein